jgi:hypothetical protein
MESAVVFISTLDQYGLKTVGFLMSGVRLSPLILRPQIGAPTVDSTQVWSNGGMIKLGKPDYCENNLPHCHSVHHKSHADYPTVKSAIKTRRPTAWGNWQCCYLEFRLCCGRITRVTKTGGRSAQKQALLNFWLRRQCLGRNSRQTDRQARMKCFSCL